MYGYIKGIVKDIETSCIILDNNGIGYIVYVANPYSYVIGNEYTVYLYSHIREDEYSLYGFLKKDEKDLFLKLISVKGIGPKMTLPLLAGNIDGVIDAINRENILYLKKFPKIGDKVARQIILDLKGKLKEVSVVEEDSKEKELVEVLVNLGYKNQEIRKILPSIKSTDELEIQIKEALKLLLNN
ncbi:MAG: Holliday junction branch migration protein RuvA [bacterium]|nr:Holliday junction branch migration protein RuvA [bacterium]